MFRLIFGVAQLAGYRLYFMNRFSGHIEHRREFFADDDVAALAQAMEWDSGQPMELWQGEHKLKRWDGAPVVSD
jgi:hypothetical protein